MSVNEYLEGCLNLYIFEFTSVLNFPWWLVNVVEKFTFSRIVLLELCFISGMILKRCVINDQSAVRTFLNLKLRVWLLHVHNRFIDIGLREGLGTSRTKVNLLSLNDTRHLKWLLHDGVKGILQFCGWWRLLWVYCHIIGNLRLSEVVTVFASIRLELLFLNWMTIMRFED